MSFWLAMLGSMAGYGVVACINWTTATLVRRRRRRAVREALLEMFGPLPEPDRAHPVPAPTNPNAN